MWDGGCGMTPVTNSTLTRVGSRVVTGVTLTSALEPRFRRRAGFDDFLEVTPRLPMRAPVAEPTSRPVPQPQSTVTSPAAAPGLVPFNGIRRVPVAVNEPVRSYAPGSPERASLKARLASMSAGRIEIPIIIGGEEVRPGELDQAP